LAKQALDEQSKISPELQKTGQFMNETNVAQAYKAKTLREQ
jgi:hypothetical protein